LLSDSVVHQYSGASICLYGLRRMSETSGMANTLAPKTPHLNVY
jgi:hypothetical protein